MLFITQDGWLNNVNIQTAGTIGLGYNSQFWTKTTEPFVPSANTTAYFEIALGNVTDWTLYATGAPMTSTASITFNVPTLNYSNPYVSIINLMNQSFPVSYFGFGNMTLNNNSIAYYFYPIYENDPYNIPVNKYTGAFATDF